MPALHALSAPRQAKPCVHRLEHSPGCWRGWREHLQPRSSVMVVFSWQEPLNMSRCTFHAHEGIFQKSKLCFEICIITGDSSLHSPFSLQLSASQIVRGRSFGKQRGKTDSFCQGLKQEADEKKSCIIFFHILISLIIPTLVY